MPSTYDMNQTERKSKHKFSSYRPETKRDRRTDAHTDAHTDPISIYPILKSILSRCVDLGQGYQLHASFGHCIHMRRGESSMK